MADLSTANNATFWAKSPFSNSFICVKCFFRFLKDTMYKMLKKAFFTYSELSCPFLSILLPLWKIIWLGVILQINTLGKIIKLWLFMVVDLLDKGQ